MGAVAAEDEVVGVEVVGHTYCSRFLTCGKVGRAGVVVFHSIVTARGLDQVEHGLELADGEHVAVDAEEILLGKIALFKFFLYSFLVLHYGDFGELDLVLFRAEGDFGIDIK